MSGRVVVARQGHVATVTTANAAKRTTMTQSSVLHAYWPAAQAFASNACAGAMGSAHPVAALYQAFPAADVWINIGSIGEAYWQRIPGVLGLLRLLDDEWFAGSGARTANRDGLVAEISSSPVRRTIEEWVEAFERAGVPARPVKTTAQVLDDPQVRARDMVITVQHHAADQVETLGCPAKLSHDTGVNNPGTSAYGEHTTEDTQELGYVQPEIKRLARSRVEHVHKGAIPPRSRAPVALPA